MSAPREHVASAVVDAIAAYWYADGQETRTAVEHIEAIARTILNSTDPAVHLAMLDALVRAGVLREERDECDLPTEPILRRYVTEWEVL